MLALEGRRGLVVIDEFQVRPELLTVLRVLVDRPGDLCRFVILGSASPDIVRGASQSLAGRVAFVDMSGFALDEVGVQTSARLHLRGGFPRHFLATSEADSYRLRDEFLRTFLERDVPALGLGVPPESARRLWTMIAHHHGQTWNGSAIGASMGVTHHTARRYLDVLAGAFVVRVLQPWFSNTSKRLVRSPKVYIRDSGLLHALLGIRDRDALLSHPQLGASWEGYCIEQVLQRTGDRDAHFWATQSRAELDLLVNRNGRPYGFEFKWADAPTRTRSMHSALTDLSLEHLWVVTPGAASYSLSDRITVIGPAQLNELLDSF